MTNPFEIIDARLSNIEGMLIKLLNNSQSGKQVLVDDRCFLKDAIEITGLKSSTIYKLTMENKIPHSHFGRKLVFSRRELNIWIEDQTKREYNHSLDVLQMAKIANNKLNRK